MNTIENIKLKVSLVVAKLDILKIKDTDGGYTWSMLTENDRKVLLKTLEDIDKIIESL